MHRRFCCVFFIPAPPFRAAEPAAAYSVRSADRPYPNSAQVDFCFGIHCSTGLKYLANTGMILRKMLLSEFFWSTLHWRISALLATFQGDRFLFLHMEPECVSPNFPRTFFQYFLPLPLPFITLPFEPLLHSLTPILALRPSPPTLESIQWISKLSWSLYFALSWIRHKQWFFSSAIQINFIFEYFIVFVSSNFKHPHLFRVFNIL